MPVEIVPTTITDPALRVYLYEKAKAEEAAPPPPEKTVEEMKREIEVAVPVPTPEPEPTPVPTYGAGLIGPPLPSGLVPVHITDPALRVALYEQPPTEPLITTAEHIAKIKEGERVVEAEWQETIRDPEAFAGVMAQDPLARTYFYTSEAERFEGDAAAFEKEWAPYVETTEELPEGTIITPSGTVYVRGEGDTGLRPEQILGPHFVGTEKQYQEYTREAGDLGIRGEALGAAYAAVSVPIETARAKVEAEGGLFRGVLFGGLTVEEARLAGYSRGDIEAVQEYKERYLAPSGGVDYLAGAGIVEPTPPPSAWDIFTGGPEAWYGWSAEQVGIAGMFEPSGVDYQSRVRILSGQIQEEHPELSGGEALRLATGIVGKQEEGLRPKTKFEEFFTITPPGWTPGTGFGIPGAELQRTWPRLSLPERAIGVATTALAYSPLFAGRAIGFGRGVIRAWRGTGLAERVATEPLYVMEPGTGIVTKLEPSISKGFYTREGLPPLTEWSPSVGMYPTYGMKVAPITGIGEVEFSAVPIWQRGYKVPGMRPTYVTEGPVGVGSGPMVRAAFPEEGFGIRGYGYRGMRLEEGEIVEGAFVAKEGTGTWFLKETGPSEEMFLRLGAGDRPIFGTFEMPRIEAGGGWFQGFRPQMYGYPFGGGVGTAVRPTTATMTPEMVLQEQLARRGVTTAIPGYGMPFSFPITTPTPGEPTPYRPFGPQPYIVPTPFPLIVPGVDPFGEFAPLPGFSPWGETQPYPYGKPSPIGFEEPVLEPEPMPYTFTPIPVPPAPAPPLPEIPGPFFMEPPPPEISIPKKITPIVPWLPGLPGLGKGRVRRRGLLEGLYGKKMWPFEELFIFMPESLSLEKKAVRIRKKGKLPYGAKRKGTKVVKGLRV